MLPVQSEFGIVCDAWLRNLDPPCRLSECVSSFFVPPCPASSLWSVFGQWNGFLKPATSGKSHHDLRLVVVPFHP